MVTRNRAELMEGLAILFPSPKTVERGADGQVPQTVPHLLWPIQGERNTLATWIGQHALGICGATGDLITECPDCKKPSGNGKYLSRATRSLEELGKYLRQSRFWYQVKDRTGPHRHEYIEAVLAVWLSVHVLNGVAG